MESRYVFKTSKGCQKPISELLLASLSQVQNHSYENEVSFTCKATRKIAPAKSAGLRELDIVAVDSGSVWETKIIAPGVRFSKFMKTFRA